MHPSVGVAAHGVASGDGAGEVGGVSHHNPHESRCDLHLWWYCSSETIEHIVSLLQYHQRWYCSSETICSYSNTTDTIVATKKCSYQIH